MPNVHLITFGDGSQDYREAAERLISQSNVFSSIDFRRAYKKEDLGAEYNSLFKEEVRSTALGFGLYSWKPWLVHKHLNSIDENDILVYIDSGCELNPHGMSRFQDYLSITAEHGMLTFELQHAQRFWTKQHHMLASTNAEHYFRNQIAGTVFFIKKNVSSKKFCDDWLALSSHKGGETLMDPGASETQIAGFRAHRHDQSTLSLTAFMNNTYHIPDETYFTRWSSALDYPILALRNRTGAQKHQALMSTNSKIMDWIKSKKQEFRLRKISSRSTPR